MHASTGNEDRKKKEAYNKYFDCVEPLNSDMTYYPSIRGSICKEYKVLNTHNTEDTAKWTCDDAGYSATKQPIYNSKTLNDWKNTNGY